ncbi:MAG: HNH endonuclease [Acidimicrobiia bacterium]
MPSKKRSDPRYRTRQWKALRLVILARDGYECQIKGHRCSKRARAVDHVVPIAQGGEFWSPANLRAACIPCNSSKGQTTDIRGAPLPEGLTPPTPPTPSRQW